MENGELTRWFSFSIFAFYGCFFVRKGAPSRHTLQYNIYHQMKFAGAVCSYQANELRDTGIPQGTFSCLSGNSPRVAPAEMKPHV